jgi:endonuclease/exonuclease/phosphatase family metal-dependent hydrolase
MKIVTYNVHGWLTTNNDNNFHQVTTFLKNIDADIICLQEVDEKRNTIDSVLICLQSHFQTMFDSCITQASSPIPHIIPYLSDVIVVKSDIGKIQQKFHYLLSYRMKQQRTMSGVIIELLNTKKQIAVFCTHLEQASENVRMEQLKIAIEQNAQKDLDLFHIDSVIYAGDFNAVCREDYSQEHWNQLQQIRDKNKWEKLSTRVHTYLTSERNLVDCYQLSDVKNNSQLVTSAQANNRIDWLLVSRQFLAAWSIQSYQVHNDCNASDHYPVSVLFHKE